MAYQLLLYFVPRIHQKAGLFIVITSCLKISKSALSIMGHERLHYTKQLKKTKFLYSNFYQLCVTLLFLYEQDWYWLKHILKTSRQILSTSIFSLSEHFTEWCRFIFAITKQQDEISFYEVAI